MTITPPIFGTDTHPRIGHRSAGCVPHKPEIGRTYLLRVVIIISKTRRATRSADFILLYATPRELK